jgi:magnesium chelatase accessory protein
MNDELTHPTRAPLTNDEPTRLTRGPLRWSTEGANWPLREHSRRVVAGGIEWHVQVLGHGRPIVLVHGTGAATHTWRDLGPLLAERWQVIAMDLPGHGFTEALPDSRMSLPGMAAAVADLVAMLVPDRAPLAMVAGHSAGAAILARALVDGALRADAFVSLNGALMPWRGPASALFAPLARVMAATPWVSDLFAWRASDRRVVERLVANTGSKIDARGLEAYSRLVRTPAHVAGALRMMANWDVAPIERDLQRLTARTLFLAGAADRTVPASESRQAHARLPGSELQVLAGLGHLAHEEAPDVVARALIAFADRD